jgi:hypothetical protein
VRLEGGIAKLDGTPESDATAALDAAATAALRDAGLSTVAVSKIVIKAHSTVARRRGAPLMPGIVTREATASLRAKRQAAKTRIALDALLKRLSFDDPAITPLLRARRAAAEISGRPVTPDVQLKLVTIVAHAIGKAVLNLLTGKAKTQRRAAEITHAIMWAAYPSLVGESPAAVTVDAIRVRIPRQITRSKAR